MNSVTGERVFYGVENINDKLDSIMKALNLEKHTFEVKLILSEALMNAFIHGNEGDNNKPICIKWEICNDNLCIEVKDSGSKREPIALENYNKDEDLLSENGRGLFIISAYTDELIFKDNTIIMKKSLA